DCRAQVSANAAPLRAGRSVEGLHQLRVAFRRLDVALAAFGREFRQDWLEELRGRGRILSARLAPARDLDVFVNTLLDPHADGEGFVQLRARAEDARATAWAAVTACVTGADFELFVDDVAALAASQLPLTRIRRLPRTASHILDRQAGRVRKRGRAARSRDEGDLHRLRIALKKLRYTAEFFAPLYAKRDVKRYLKKLRALQNHLGALNDAANVRGTVSALLQGEGKQDATMGFAAGSLVGWHGARAPRTARQALKRYRSFRKLTPFWVK
ncbi:MAG TPA: CHAD domain-containing protein, partial [Rhizomicrobium sp.]|nr:CHAD domain-containing protein [Rhizomicrobium sp.]